MIETCLVCERNILRNGDRIFLNDTLWRVMNCRIKKTEGARTGFTYTMYKISNRQEINQFRKETINEAKE